MIGQTISHYKILEKLGEGGMGVVYKAEDTKLKRIVALKFLPQHLTSTETEQSRFRQEAQAAAALNHPNICAIHTIEEYDGQQFIDMEFIDGTTLRQKIPIQKIQDVLTFAIQVAEALQEAHSKGIVHRDIKADNIMINSRNQVKVMDFGLAKLKGSAMLTKSSSTVGTLAYMSPEQIQGEAVDARSDIFSFGVVLFEMLTGTLPFRGEHEAAMMYSIINEEPEPIRKYLPELSSDFIYIIDKALEKSPNDRYQSVNEILVDLRRVKRQSTKVIRSQVYAVPSSAKLPEVIETPHTASVAKPVRAKMWIMTGGLAIILAGAIVYSLVAYFNKPKVPAALQLSFTQLTDEPGIETNPDISPDGNYIVYERWIEHKSIKIFLERIGGGNPINLTSDSESDFGEPTFSPDGQQIAFVQFGRAGGIFLMGATGENVRRLTDFGYLPAWSPDGKEIICATDLFVDPNIRTGRSSELWTITVATGEKRKIKDGDAIQPQWSPHGYRIAYWGIHAGGRRDIWTIPAAGGDSVAVTDDAYVDWDPVWSPDGKYLYFSSDRGGSMNLWRISIDEQTGKILSEPQSISTPSRYSGFLRISHDGHRLIYAAIDERQNVYSIGFDPVKEAAVGLPIAVTQGTRMFDEFDPSPDGEWIALGSTGTQEDIYVIRKDGTGLRQLTNDVYKDRAISWMPDGKRIAFMSDRSGKYDVWSINLDGSNLEQLTKTHLGFIGPFRELLNTNSLVCWSDSGLFVFDLSKPLNERNGEKFQPIGKDDKGFTAVSLSSDTEWFAGSADTSSLPGVVLYSKRNETYESVTDSGYSPFWLNDNRRLLYLRNGKLFIVDRETKKTHEVANQPENLRRGLIQISSDNHTLYYMVGTKEANIWQVTMKESQSE